MYLIEMQTEKMLYTYIHIYIAGGHSSHRSNRANFMSNLKI